MKTSPWLITAILWTSCFVAPALGVQEKDYSNLSADALTSQAEAAKEKAEAANAKIVEKKEELKAAKGKLSEAEKTPDELEPLKEARANVETAEAAVAEAEAELETSLDELEALVTAMGAKDEIESSTMRPYKAYLLEQGRVGSLDTDAVVGIVDQWYQKGKTWVVEEGPGILVTIVQFIVILIAFSILSKIAGKIVGRMLRTSRLKVSDLLRSFFVNTATKLVFLFGLVIALGTIGIDVGPLLAAIGVVGFVIGFALQDTLANFASGIMILLYRPYDIGDVIKAAGVLGTVKAMNLVSTTVVTGDNQCEIVPNKSIWGGVITNITANSTRRVDLTIGVGYQDDLQQVKSVIVDILEKHPKILKDPAPVVRLHNLGESSVDFVVRPWCATSDYWAVYWDLHEQIKERLDQEGISIPYPQRDLHLHYVEGHAPAAS